MARVFSENRNKAFEIYKKHQGRIKSKDIAEMLNEKVSNINYWRSKDNWADRLKGGAPKGNKNSVGNRGGGAPKGHLNNYKHGNYIDSSRFSDKKFLAKYLPKATAKIINDIVKSGIDSLDMIWSSIMLKYAAILRAQEIMFVENKDEIVKQLKRKKISENTEEYEYELQFAWDRQERFLKAQATAMKELSNLIQQYEELLHKNWDLASEEQKLRLDKLKGEVDKLTGKDDKGPIKIEFVKASGLNE